MVSETLPSACYILSDESSMPFYSTSNGYKNDMCLKVTNLPCAYQIDRGSFFFLCGNGAVVGIWPWPKHLLIRRWRRLEPERWDRFREVVFLVQEPHGRAVSSLRPRSLPRRPPLRICPRCQVSVVLTWRSQRIPRRGLIGTSLSSSSAPIISLCTRKR